jgi:hypothetical protein
MDIIRKLRRLESRLAKTVNDASQRVSQASTREPLEVLYAIVDAAERRIEPAGRGRFVFPFNRVRVHIAADSREARARFEAVFAAEPSLQKRILERLHAAGCERDRLNIDITYVAQSEPHWSAREFDIEFDRVDDNPVVAPQSLKLTVVHGTTEKPAYVFTTTRINIGRCADVRDNCNRLIRTNHVAFAESAGEPNLSVSRHHAHIDCADDSGEYRLCDDRSAHGTCVLRNGKTIAVPSGPRGVRLQSGDEISVGEARLVVEIGTGEQGSNG